MANVYGKGLQYSGPKVADALIKTGSGFLHTIQISCNDAAPTAGTVSIYDGVAAGTGNVIYSETFTTTAFRGYSIELDVYFNTGLFIDFTTTADVNVAVSYE